MAVVVLALSSGRGAAADPDGTALARQHFERGYAAARQGQVELAVAEFEQAYAASPNPSVLFNLGQAYASAGRAVEAVDTLRRYLELGGDAVSAERRAFVEELIAYHSRSIGQVALDVVPAGADVTLDGRSVGVAPLDGPLRALRGTHSLVVSKPGHERHEQSLELGAVPASVRVVLQPSAPSVRLHVRCVLPDVALALDGRSIGRTPLGAPLAVPPGVHEIELARPGYVTERLKLELYAGQDAEVPCTLRATAPTSTFARLTLTHPMGTRAWIDAQPFTGQRLPPGRHRLTVTGPGFEQAERTALLPPDSVTKLTILPAKKSDSVALELADRKRTQRIAAYIVGGAGALAGITAVALLAYNGGKYAEWEQDRDAFLRDYAQDPETADPGQLDELLADERAIRNRDALALGAGVLGGVLLTTGVVLFFTSRPEEPAFTVTGNVALERDRTTPLPRITFAGAF